VDRLTEAEQVARSQLADVLADGKEPIDPVGEVHRA
jgi:hypothetical protein